MEPSQTMREIGPLDGIADADLLDRYRFRPHRGALKYQRIMDAAACHASNASGSRLKASRASSSRSSAGCSAMKPHMAHRGGEGSAARPNSCTCTPQWAQSNSIKAQHPPHVPAPDGLDLAHELDVVPVAPGRDQHL